MFPVQIRFTKEIIEKLDELVSKGMYSSRSEVIRDAIRNHITSFNKNNLKEGFEDENSST